MKDNDALYGKLSRRLKWMYKRTYWLYVFCSRYAYCKKELRKINDGGYPSHLDKEDQLSVEKIWGRIKPDSRWFSFYNSIKREGNTVFDPRYVPLDIQYCMINTWFNSTVECRALDDKNMYDMYFHDVRMPRTVARIVAGQYMDVQYRSISLEEAVCLCSVQRSVVVKPSVGTGGGEGIAFWNLSDGEDALKNILKLRANAVIQELIVQHPELDKLHRGSVNSIRIMTCGYEGVTYVPSTVVRIGAGGSRVDNATQGGLFCGVLENGQLKRYAYNKRGETFTKTAEGVEYAQCSIPNFDKCKDLVLNLSNRFFRVSKLISWDLSVGADGEPLLIEVNLANGGVDIHQIANGPLFGDKTEKIIGEALNAKRYRRYKRIMG